MEIDVMVTRGLAACVSLVVVSVAQAGAVIDLTLNGYSPPPYFGGETVLVDYTLRQDSAVGSIRLRMLQFDMSASDQALALQEFNFRYDGQPICIQWFCGYRHTASESLTDGDGAIVTLLFDGAEDDPLFQIWVPESAPVLVGQMQLALPTSPGTYTLDVLNAGAADVVNAGAQVMFGFGGPDPTTYWRATEGNVTGGRYTFEVIPEPTTLAMLALGALVVLRRRGREGSRGSQ